MEASLSTNDMSIFSLIAEASPVVQVVMGILFLMSLLSWWHIFVKWFGLRHAKAKTDSFESSFWERR